MEPTSKTVYYLTGAPIVHPGTQEIIRGKASTRKGESKGAEHLHLVTYELRDSSYRDHGPIMYRNRGGYPTYVNSIALAETPAGVEVFALGRMENGMTDCFRFFAT